MSDQPEPRQWYAVIDIGSNSVRLVIYDVAGSAMVAHYNEKVMASLGAGLSDTGKLSPKGIEIAVKALGRYQAILRGLNVLHVKAVATAAVRLASDGPDFVTRVEAETGLAIQVITGEEEGRLSALGLLAGFHGADGVVGDLGGSSLELCPIAGGKVGQSETYNLGPLQVDTENMSAKELTKRVREKLRKSDALRKAGGRFYLIGGAWRGLAKLHMNVADYPLRQLHAYRMTAQDIRKLRDLTHLSDTVTRERIAKAGERRAKILPYASIVLNELFEAGGFVDAMVSSCGLREGVVLDQLGPSEALRDPLLDGVALAARLETPRRAFGEALFDWIAPVIEPGADLFGEADIEPRVIAAACLLADAGARSHPDTRAKLVYEQTLHGPYVSVTHSERAFIALAVGCRYSRHYRASSKMEGLLTKRQVKLAQRLGAAMRLGAVYSGRSAAVLKQARLSCDDDDQLVLSTSPANRALVSATVERRLRSLAEYMGLNPAVQFG